MYSLSMLAVPGVGGFVKLRGRIQDTPVAAAVNDKDI